MYMYVKSVQLMYVHMYIHVCSLGRIPVHYMYMYMYAQDLIL